MLWLLAGGCDPALPTSAPMLLPGEHRFGTVVHGQKVEHTWLLSAAVPRAFEVRGVIVPCSCAYPTLVAIAPGGARRAVTYLPAEFPFKVAAGERLELTLVFDSDKKLARDWEENFQTVVHTDLTEQREVPFKFQAAIRVPLLLKPGPEVDLGGLNEHQTSSTLVTLTPRDGQRFKVLDIVRLVFDEQTRKDRECPLDGLTYKQTVGDDGEHRYLFESPPGRTYDENRFFRRVAFKTDLPGNYRLEVQFRAQRIPAITFEPLGSISFGRVTPGQTAEQQISMHQNVPGELFTAELDRVEVTVEGKPAEAADHFELRLEPIPAIRVVRLIARYVKPFEGRYFRGKIHLKTSLPDSPTVYVDVVGFHDR